MSHFFSPFFFRRMQAYIEMLVECKCKQRVLLCIDLYIFCVQTIDYECFGYFRHVFSCGIINETIFIPTECVMV